MNAACVILTVLGDNLQEERFVIDEPSQWRVGRGSDCDIQIPSSPLNADVSRHHCKFDIDPPTIRVSDLGSLNGTFVNGEMIGCRRRNCNVERRDGGQSGVELKDGDIIQVGKVALVVSINREADADELDSSSSQVEHSSV